MKIKMSKSQWEQVGKTAGWMPRDPMGVSDLDLGPMYTAEDEENALLGKEDSIEEVRVKVYEDGYQAGIAKETIGNDCPYKSGTNLSDIWWKGFEKGKELKLKESKKTPALAKSIKIIKVAEVFENIVPVEQILGTNPSGMTEAQLDQDMHSKGYFLFREHYKWGKTLSYQNKNGEKVFLEKDDSGKLTWMTFSQLKEQVKKTWRPASREDQDWFVANLGN